MHKSFVLDIVLNIQINVKNAILLNMTKPPVDVCFNERVIY